MNFLFLNNYHYLRGGSERVYFGEMELLRARGHRVVPFSRRYPKLAPGEDVGRFAPDLPPLRSPAGLREFIYSPTTKRCLKRLLGEFRPEVAHAHNIYGRLTTSVLDALREEGVPVVMTLHDYKLICPTYLMLSDGRPCERCRGRRFWWAALRRCHRQGLVPSVVYALEAAFNALLRKYERNVALFIAPSRFMIEKCAEFGLSRERFVHVPNFIDPREMEPSGEYGDHLVYFGRLSAEKGLLTLLRAFRLVKTRSARLILAGEGPMRGQLEREAQRLGLEERVRFTGHLASGPLWELVRGARAVALPSEWYENAPFAVIEAMALARPVVGSRIGGIPEMVQEGQTGYLFEPGNAEDLAAKLELVLRAPRGELAEMGLRARRLAEERYGPEEHYRLLMEVYGRVRGG